MVLTDSLISGPIPGTYCTATIHCVIASCLTVPWDKCNRIFTLTRKSAENELPVEYEDVQMRTLLPFCPAKAAVGAADA